MEFIRPSILIFWSFFYIFLICDFGENVSHRFDSINYNIGQLKWTEFSIAMQSILPMMLMSTQRPVVIHGFGNVLLRRDVFSDVISIIYSIVMKLIVFFFF